MTIHGFNKFTLVDYPGLLGATIFLGGCNFRCPFCHNKGLVLTPNDEPVIPEEEVLAYLKERVGKVEGVCITGGEATLQPELETFIRKIRDLGYKIKLDSNGYRPDVLKDLYNKGLIDYVAMDIKATKENYPKACGIENVDLSKIQESIDFIMNNVGDYEFRTTLCKELHSPEDVKEIRNWLKGCKLHRLQSYRETEGVINPIFTGYSDEELEELNKIQAD